MPRTTEELRRACVIQSRHLTASCRAYDAGDVWEALRIATIVYIMVHDAGRNRSIFNQLGIKHHMMFMATGAEVSFDLRKRADRFTPLVEFESFREERRKNANLKMVPRFVPVSTYWHRRGKQPALRQLTFEDWWETDIIFFDDEKALTRKKLVLTLRNQEGGSHLDPEVVNPNYLALRKPFWMVTLGYGFGQMAGLELATMRQIAEELKISIQTYNWLQSMRKKAS